ncbi:hypothetical protein PG987_003128 [Apiospora arundinis]
MDAKLSKRTRRLKEEAVNSNRARNELKQKWAKGKFSTNEAKSLKRTLEKLEKETNKKITKATKAAADEGVTLVFEIPSVSSEADTTQGTDDEFSRPRRRDRTPRRPSGDYSFFPRSNGVLHSLESSSTSDSGSMSDSSSSDSSDSGSSSGKSRAKRRGKKRHRRGSVKREQSSTPGFPPPWHPNASKGPGKESTPMSSTSRKSSRRGTTPMSPTPPGENDTLMPDDTGWVLEEFLPHLPNSHHLRAPTEEESQPFYMNWKDSQTGKVVRAFIFCMLKNHLWIFLPGLNKRHPNLWRGRLIPTSLCQESRRRFKEAGGQDLTYLNGGFLDGTTSADICIINVASAPQTDDNRMPNTSVLLLVNKEGETKVVRETRAPLLKRYDNFDAKLATARERCGDKQLIDTKTGKRMSPDATPQTIEISSDSSSPESSSSDESSSDESSSDDEERRGKKKKSKKSKESKKSKKSKKSTKSKKSRARRKSRN